MLLRLFLKGEGTNKKTENVWSSSLVRGTKNPNKVWACVAAFGRKIGTTPLGYFQAYFLDAFMASQLNWSCAFLSFLEFGLEFFRDFA